LGCNRHTESSAEGPLAAGDVSSSATISTCELACKQSSSAMIPTPCSSSDMRGWLRGADGKGKKARAPDQCMLATSLSRGQTASCPNGPNNRRRASNRAPSRQAVGEAHSTVRKPPDRRSYATRKKARRRGHAKNEQWRRPRFGGIKKTSPYRLPRRPLWSAFLRGRLNGAAPAFTMLTCEPGPDVAPIHNRQIVVLDRDQWTAWLNPEP
jgi:hypothetical protein